MGAEDKGVTPKILGLSDDKVKIPLKGEISSLNVSVAAAILMFEVVKNRNL
jgi:23S rRNA (guanosine2251-2'-O)-methyltransferase